jgi:hypothetical protein
MSPALNERLSIRRQRTMLPALRAVLPLGLMLLGLLPPIGLRGPWAHAASLCDVGPPQGALQTTQIQEAIDRCWASGGGDVRLSAGAVYTSGTLELRSNITLNLNGATLEAASDPEAFRSLKCDWCHEMFVGTGSGAKHVGLIGPGTIRKPAGSDTEVAMVEFWDSSYVTVRDLVLDTLDAPASANGFHLVSSASDHVTFESVTVRGGRAGGQAWGNDGIDIQSSQHVVLRDCDVNTHDDGIALASSSGSGEPLHDVLIQNCRVASDSAALKFGTGSEYDMWDITYEDITLHHSPYGIRFSIYDGAVVSDVTIRRLTAESSVNRLFVCGGGTSAGRNVHDCTASIDRDGDGEAETLGGTIQDVLFENFEVYGGGATDTGSYHQASINNMTRVTFRDVRYHDGSGSAPLAWFRDLCGLSISGFNSHLTGDPERDLRIDPSVEGLRLDGGEPLCAGVPPTPTSTPGPQPTPTETPAQAFEDVPPTHWAYPYIQILYENGYVVGCSLEPRKFCPAETLDRAESAVFVMRGHEGSDYQPPEPAELAFADVVQGDWFADWVAALWGEGFTAGCGDDPLIYCPHDLHTRAQGSVFFLRVKHGVLYEPPAAQGLFADTPSSEWHARWVEAAYQAGLLTPCQTEPELLACPLGELDRATAAFMMAKARGLGP